MGKWQFVRERNRWTEHVVGEGLDVFYGYEYVNLNSREGETAELFLYTGQRGKLFYPYLRRDVYDTGYQDLITPYGYGGPVETGQLTDREIAEARFVFVEYAKRQRIICELIRFHPLKDNVVLGRKWTECEFIRHTTSIDLRPSLEEIFKKFHKKTRLLIRNSMKSELKVRKGEKSDLPIFVELYRETMRRKQAAPSYYFSEQYFERIFEENELCEPVLLIAEWNEEPVGAYLLLFGEQYAHGHLIGSRPDMMKLYPNQRLEYEAVRIAKERGLLEQHLGGGYKESDSLFESKCRYTGKRLFEYHQGKSIFMPEVYESMCERYGEETGCGFFPRYRATRKASLLSR